MHDQNFKNLPSAGYYDSDNIVARLNLPNMSYRVYPVYRIEKIPRMTPYGLKK
jgi:hypothetical protein